MASALAERDNEFDLELEIRCERRIGNARTVQHERIAGLLKEERRIALVGFLHFPDVVEIVAADAIDASNRKGAATGDRSFSRGDRRKRVRSLTAHFLAPAAWP